MLPKLRYVVMVTALTLGVPNSSARAESTPVWDAPDAWEKASDLVGEHIHLRGDATVKRSKNGVYVVFVNKSGRPIGTVSVSNGDDEDLKGLAKLEVGGSLQGRVKVSTHLKGFERGYMLLEVGLLLALEASEDDGGARVAEKGKVTESWVRAEAGPRVIPSREANSGLTDCTADGGMTSTAGTYAGSSVTLESVEKPVKVRGYYRRDGTYVRPHTRALPGMGTRRR